ncbi:MAG: hypothetical protein ACI4FO_07800 [Acutalibacteraceae bacterium]
MENKSDKQRVTISKKTLAITVIVVLLLIAGGVILGLNWNNWFGEQPAPTTQSATMEVDPNAGQYNGQQPEDKGGEAEGIKIPGYPSITIPANQTDVTVALLNPEGNPCYFVFELVLKDTDETLYTSKLVPPGQAITDITLSKPLKAGEHNAVIKISTYSLENQSPMNGANVETVLIAK